MSAYTYDPKKHQYRDDTGDYQLICIEDMPTAADWYDAWKSTAGKLVQRGSIDLRNPVHRKEWEHLQTFYRITRDSVFAERGMCPCD